MSSAESFNKMMEELRSEYLASFPQKYSDIELHLQARDFTRLRDDFHKLKGTGKTYGIPEISELCAIIEKVCLNAAGASSTTAGANLSAAGASSGSAAASSPARHATAASVQSSDHSPAPFAAGPSDDSAGQNAAESVTIALAILRKIVASRLAGHELNLANVSEFARLHSSTG